MGYIILMKNEKQNDPTRAADSQDHRPVQDQSPTDQGFGPNANLDKSHPLREQIQVQPEEINWAGQGCIQPDTGERAYDPPLEERNMFATDGGWPGDGSGMDDLADFNQMEGWDN